MNYVQDLGRKKQIQSEDEAINVALSYMKGGKADGWVEVFEKKHHDVATDAWGMTFNEFREELIKSFTNVTKEQEAKDKLQYIQQGTDTADDFFKEFEILLDVAGYSQDDSFIITLIKRAVNDKLIDSIITNSPAPITDYDEYRDRIIALDSVTNH